MSSFTVYSYPQNYRVQKAQIAAAYNGISLNMPAFEFGKDNKTPEFQAKFPLGKVPAMDTPDGPIYESTAIARYIARLRPDSHLFGKSFYETGLVDQWLDSCANELEAPRGAWIYPILGYMKYNYQTHQAAKADVQKYLAMMNEHLLKNTYLVGEQITLADISVTCSLVQMYKMLFDPKFLEAYPNVTRWFNTCIHQPEFAGVIGEVKFATEEAKPPKQKKEKKKKDNQQQGKQGKKKGSKKKGSKKKGGSKKGKKGKKKEEKKEELIDGIPKKQWKLIDKEGGKKGQDLQGMSAFGCNFFQTVIDSADGDHHKLDIVMAAMNKPCPMDAEERRGGADSVGKILASSGEKQLVLQCHVPKALQEATPGFNMAEWFASACNPVGAVVDEAFTTEETMRATAAGDPEKNRFPLKMRDEAVGQAYAYLLAKKLVMEDDGSEDEDFAAAAGVSWGKDGAEY